MLKPKHLAILVVVVVALAGVSFLQKSSHERRTGRPARLRAHAEAAIREWVCPPCARPTPW